MIWVLFALLGLLVWALWLVLPISVWIPIGATLGLGLLAGGIVLFRRFAERQRSRGLENAIAAQGMQQAMNAKPERRAEIQELQKQVLTGITALKKSKLGGKKGGVSAMYRLPWYMIIGPPGAGKTTALKHSGLVFPYADSSGGGVRGVGGTRNCDWWFTNDAILLDTAGRYTTEATDQDEWVAFLAMLKKYRPKRPINGILVAISITDLIDASEQQIEMTGKKLRARIDEVMTQLQMTVPVYVLFTKCDLIAGFTEIFGDLRKSDRAQAWGTTFKLTADKNQPGQLFATEFDILAKQVHSRSLKRLAQERAREAREKIYQFPLEFTAIKKNLADLVQTVFQPNPFQGSPIFRGFYFTSGTQEGRPLDRAMAKMAHVMGIRPPEAEAQRANVESKSYFLFDVFEKVVFPDGELATRSTFEKQRQLLMRLAIAAAAAALALVVAIPGLVSFINNKDFVDDTKTRAKAAAEVTWNDGRPPTEKLAKMTPLLERLRELDTHHDDGVPFGMGWFMYTGKELAKPAMHVYVDGMQKGFAAPCMAKLEAKLEAVTGSKYLTERRTLKEYLLLGDPEHLEDELEWETGKLTSLWAEILRPSLSNTTEAELKKSLEPHVAYYLELVRGKRVPPMPLKKELVERVRAKLQAVPLMTRYYDQFVNSIADQKLDESGDASRANRKYQSLTIQDLFTDRPEVLTLLKSKRALSPEKAFQEVEGPYTEKGYRAVIDQIEEGAGFLNREAWVVPLTREEDASKMPQTIKTTLETYQARYIIQWNDWLADLTVQPPASLKDAIVLYTQLAKPDWPYLRVLRALEDSTQFRKGFSPVNDQAAKNMAYKEVQNKLNQNRYGIKAPSVKASLEKLTANATKIQDTYKRTVEFAIPAGKSNVPLTDTALAKYVSLLELLRDEMQKVEDRSPGADARLVADKLQDAYKQIETLLRPFDGKARMLLYPLLTNPLRVGSVARMLPTQMTPDTAAKVDPTAPATPKK